MKKISTDFLANNFFQTKLTLHFSSNGNCILYIYYLNFALILLVATPTNWKRKNQLLPGEIREEIGLLKNKDKNIQHSSYVICVMPHIFFLLKNLYIQIFLIYFCNLKYLSSN